MKAHISFCLSLLDKKQATEVLATLNDDRDKASATSSTSAAEKSPKELRESLEDLKQMCADIKAQLRKRKHVQKTPPTELKADVTSADNSVAALASGSAGVKKDADKESVKRELFKIERECSSQASDKVKPGRKPGRPPLNSGYSADESSTRLPDTKREKWTPEEHEAFL